MKQNRYYQNPSNSQFFKFADLLLVFSVAVSFLNYQQNVKQAGIAEKNNDILEDIDKNLEVINHDGIVKRLSDHIKKEN